MFWKKKSPKEAAPTGITPPWENIDAIPQKTSSTSRTRINVIGFVSAVTGFSPLGTKIFLLGFAVTLNFAAFVFYQTSTAGEPPPPRMNRPAMEKNATSSFQAI